MERLAEICKDLGLDAQVRANYVNVVFNGRAIYLVEDGDQVRIEDGPKEFSSSLEELPQFLKTLL